MEGGRRGGSDFMITDCAVPSSPSEYPLHCRLGRRKRPGAISSRWARRRRAICERLAYGQCDLRSRCQGNESGSGQVPGVNRSNLPGRACAWRRPGDVARTSGLPRGRSLSGPVASRASATGDACQPRACANAHAMPARGGCCHRPNRPSRCVARPLGACRRLPAVTSRCSPRRAKTRT
ncbi:hypothetical protein xavtCFBP7764_07985 [Xanthomonas citri]|nr:hypothetical protein xavtCFBP7764_07985 [Xanthomonas citri]